MAIPTASASVSIKLASIAVHADEYIGPRGHPHDAEAIRSLLQDDEVRAYLDALARLALTPVKRD